MTILLVVALGWVLLSGLVMVAGHRLRSRAPRTLPPEPRRERHRVPDDRPDDH